VHVDPIEPANLEMNGLVPEKWHEVFGRVLAKKPDDRYQTATEFVQDLEYCLGAWFGALEETAGAGPAARSAPPAMSSRSGEEVTAALPAIADQPPPRKTTPPVPRPASPLARGTTPPTPVTRPPNPAASTAPPQRKTTPPAAPAPTPGPPRSAPPPARRTGPPTANLGTGATRVPAASAPEPESAEEATVLMKAPPAAGRRPAAPGAPVPEEADAATVLMRAPGRSAAGARPARAAMPEPESEEPSTIVMRSPDTEAPPRAMPPPLPPIGQPPAPPQDGVLITETAPVAVMPEPRRSILTLALAGIGLLLFLIVLSTAVIVLWKRRPPTPAASPITAQAPSPVVRPSAPPPAVTSGLVHVESIPVGAGISVDGKKVGQTPLDVHDLPLGAHEIKVELDGYAPAIESVMLTAQTPRTEVRPTLSRTAPATGTADVSSTPAGAMVKIDSTAVGLTPLRGRTLNVGRHRFEITAEGYDPYTTSVTVKEGQAARVDAQLKATAKPSPKVVLAPTPPPAPTPDSHVYDENDATLSAKPVKTTGKSAEYPKEAAQLKRGQRASVTCSFVVLETGDVTDVQVVESAGEAVDNAVVSAYRSWKFTPGMKQGAKVKVRVTRRQTFLGG
jgi:TonB family protein